MTVCLGGTRCGTQVRDGHMLPLVWEARCACIRIHISRTQRCHYQGLHVTCAASMPLDRGHFPDFAPAGRRLSYLRESRCISLYRSLIFQCNKRSVRSRGHVQCKLRPFPGLEALLILAGQGGLSGSTPSSNWAKLQPVHYPHHHEKVILLIVSPGYRHCPRRESEGGSLRCPPDVFSYPELLASPKMISVAHYRRHRYRQPSSFLLQNRLTRMCCRVAGPSRSAVPVPKKLKEGGVVLPAPSEDKLINELRQMVSGHLSLNEARKAYVFTSLLLTSLTF